MITIESLPAIDLPRPKRELCVMVVAPNDRPKKELLITGDRISRYSQQCGADYLVIDKLPPVGHACAYKHVLSQVAPLYAQTLMVDTDIVIRDNCPNIFAEVPIGLWGMTDDLPRIRMCGGSEWIDREWVSVCDALGLSIELAATWNSGLVIAPPDAYREYHAPSVPVPNLWCVEQHAFTHELLKNPSRVHTLPMIWQAGYPWIDFLDAAQYSHTIHINGCHHHPTRLALLEHFCQDHPPPIPDEILKTIRSADWAPWWVSMRRDKRPVRRIEPSDGIVIEAKPCECPVSGWCDRHALMKHDNWHQLCQRSEKYRRAWDAGRGPGQPKQPLTVDEKKKRASRIADRNEKSAAAWRALHRYAVDNYLCWDEIEAARWYRKEWLRTIPRYGCKCQEHWRELTKKFPPDFSSAKAFFEWGWARHNDVSTNYSKKPTISLADAYSLHWTGYQLELHRT